MNTPDTEIKKWFEANYLDGDEVQDGQMLASSECLDALSSRDTYWKERVRKEVEGMYKDQGGKPNKVYSKEDSIYNQALDTVIEKIKNK